MKCKIGIMSLVLSGLCWTSAHAYGISDNIYAAALSGDYMTIESYLRSGYSIDTTDSVGQTPLCKAYVKKQWNAYNLLARYGANTHANCMTANGAQYDKRSLVYTGSAIVIGGVAIVALAGGGSSSESNTSSSDSGNEVEDNGNSNSDNDSGNNGGSADNGGSNTGNDNNNNNNNNNDNGGNTDNGGSNTGNNNNNNGNGGNTDNGGSNSGNNNNNGGNTSEFYYYSVDDFRKQGGIFYKEFSGRINSKTEDVVENGVTYKSANFLDSIRAAEAFSKYYGYGNNKSLLSKLGTQKNIVAVLDSGVMVNHSEFLDDNNNSKISGMNFDYGPCSSGDNSNCWKVSQVNSGDDTGWVRTLVDASGKEILVDGVYTKEAMDNWLSKYKDDYDRDAYVNTPDPLVGVNTETASPMNYMHGTHVAGIIAAGLNFNGMMGVAFSNTNIFALRYDLAAPYYLPMAEALKKNAVAINISIGTDASKDHNASLVQQQFSSLMNEQNLQAAIDTIDSYKSGQSTLNNKSVTDGMIWIMAAGNESYSEPTLLAGLKNLGELNVYDLKQEKDRTVDFNQLMMLTVISADVTMDSNGKVSSYKKSSYSNACGSTAAYCIAAPGGEIDTASAVNKMVWSTVPTDDEVGKDFGGMIGTSQAAPVVTGSIAFMHSAFPYLHSSEVIEILLETANKTAASDYSASTYGAGLLDLGKAVTTYITPETGVSTVEGTTVYTPYVYMGDTHLVLPSYLSIPFLDAMPETLTLFDRYYRPFEVATSRYITTTHSGYKALKNDVTHIVPNLKLKHEQEGNISFAYSEAPMGSSGGFGFMDTSFKAGKFSSGFFLSENTRYGTLGGKAADMNNPFMSFNSAYGAHIGYDMNSKYGIKLQAVSGRNGLYDGDKDFNDRTFTKTAYAVDTELDFRPSKKLSLAFNSGMLYEDDALLGMNGAGAFGLPESRTYYTGVTAAYKAGKKWTFSGSYYQGMTEAQSFNSNMLKTGTLISSSFAVDANYRYNKTTDFGFRISSPLRIEHGKLRIDMASGRDDYSDTVYRNQYAASMKPNKREYKFALYANKAVNDNLSISSEFDVRVNPEHRAASNDYRALFGLAWNF